MAIPTENSATQSAHDMVRHRYKKAIELEKRLRNSIQTKTPSDPNIWSQMRENYEAIILEDHDFAEANEIEHLLWHLHYKRIEEFRIRMRSAIAAAGGNVPAQGGRSVVRREQVNKIRSLFKSFLSEATGFYHELILKIKAKYRFPGDIFSQQAEDYLGSPKDKTKSVDFKKAQASCHRCLIYLGDLARYKELYGEGDAGRDFSVATSYYKEAASLSPGSGNPHHQLAILASYTGDELVAVYRYFRSLAVENPFSTARDNLYVIFEKNRQHYCQIHEAETTVTKQKPTKAVGRGRGRGDVKLAMNEEKQDTTILKRKPLNIEEVNKTFRVRFVRLNGILFTRTSLETFNEVYSSSINEFEELLTPGANFEMGIGSDTWDNGSTFCGLVVLQLVAILIFTVHHLNADAENRNLSYAEILQRSVLLQNAFTASFGFAGHIIKGCLNREDVLSSPFLPAVLVFLEWLASRRDVVVANESVEEKQANARSFFWKNCVVLLNKLLGLEIHQDSNGGRLEGEITFTSLNRYNEEEAGGVALWEDVELRGFLPLAPAQVTLDFSKRQTYNGLNGKKERNIRVPRMLAAGKAVASLLEGSGQGLIFDADMIKFRDVRDFPVYKIKEECGAVKPKVSIPLKIHDNNVQEAGPDSLKQDKHVLCVKSVPNVKPDSNREEEEDDDEVIVFKPILTDKNTESGVLNVHQGPVIVAANTSIQNPTAAFAPQESHQKYPHVPSITEFPLQISQCSSSLAPGMDDSSSAFSNPQELTKLPVSSASPVDHWSTGIGISASGISNSLDSWGMKGYGGHFVNNHASITSMADAIQQATHLTNKPNPLWNRDHELNVLNGMMNLNVGHQFTGNGSMFKSELPLGTMGKLESVSQHPNMIPSQGVYSSIPNVSGLSLGTGVANMPGKSLELAATKFELLSRSDTDTLANTTGNITVKPANVPTLSSKKGPVNRPVRHFGPPPGFGPVPSRVPDGSKVDSIQRTLAASYGSEQMQKNELHQLDDYSWLDGYTPLNKDTARNDSLVPQSGYSFMPVSDSLINAPTNFPFPGKQVPHMQMFQEQSLWSGRFFGRDP